MNVKELYQELLNAKYPTDMSSNEILVDILFDLKMYDDYVCGAVDKYLAGLKVNLNDLKYEDNIENRLEEFIKKVKDTDKDKIVAEQYLKYLLRIKKLLNEIEYGTVN